MQEQQGYGAYSGTGSQSNQSYQPYYEGTPQPSTPPQHDMYDDAFIDSLSLRLSQRMAQGPSGKIKVKSNVGGTPGRATAGQKLALAIVSLCLFMVIVLALVQSSTVSGFTAVVCIGIAALVFIVVNAIFDNLA